MTGATAVIALVLIEWTAGWIGIAAWSQSWNEIRRGHFRITAWVTVALAIIAFIAGRSALVAISDRGLQLGLLTALLASAIVYLLVQYSNTDVPGTVVGAIAGLTGAAALASMATLIPGWPGLLGAVELLSGMLLLGGVMNGMMLGHWYLNQPGMKTNLLGRLTTLSLIASVGTGVLGIAAASRLSGAETEGAVLGLPGFGNSFGTAFFVAWLVLTVFTGGVVWAARRCVQIRSIQSATGLFYVAVLSAGVAEFLIRYLMLNAG